MHRIKWMASVGFALLATATAPAAPPSFSKDVQPFLTKYCVECHGDKKPKKGLNFTSYENLMKGAKQKPVVPGKPQNSLLILTMESRGKKKMPPPKYKSQPTAKEIAVVKAWVQAGAKDDSAAGASGRRKDMDALPRASAGRKPPVSLHCAPRT